jgi:Protein of unknown function (DUF3443)
MQFHRHFTTLLAAGLLAGCVHSNGPATVTTAAPTANTAALTVDSGPAAATGQINHLYVTVKICAAGSQSQCANIDHVLVDTGSSGLRLVRSVLAAASVTLTAQTDSQGASLEECLSFVGGQTWGPVALADVTLAGERAAGLPVQIMDDTGAGAPPPATCGAAGTLLNDVAGFGANGILGIGVFAQDCGGACVNASTPQPLYYGCTAAGACTAENVALANQVTNPVWKFATDNNGVIVSLPALQNANGDASVQGELIFGIATQADNALPLAGLAVLGTDANGDVTTHYNGGATALPGMFDSGTDSYQFDDPAIAVCASGAYIGYYCPTVAPLAAFAVNTGVGTLNATSTVNFAVDDPNSFVAGATAFTGLAGGGGSTRFTWGMPFFYGRKVYVGLEQRTAGSFTGPYYAY